MNNIPKVIHLIWIGDINKFTFDIEKSKKIMPNYEFKIWEEKDFDWDELLKIPYVKKAYYEKEYAFLVDYLRLIILEKEGGIFLDADMKILKSFDPLFENKNKEIFSFENTKLISMSFLAVKENNLFLAELKKYYDNFKDGKYVMGNIFWTKLFREKGIKINGKEKEYPQFIIKSYKDFSLLEKRFRNSKKITQYCLHIHNYSWIHNKYLKKTVSIISLICQKLPFLFSFQLFGIYWGEKQINKYYY